MEEIIIKFKNSLDKTCRLYLYNNVWFIECKNLNSEDLQKIKNIINKTI